MHFSTSALLLALVAAAEASLLLPGLEPRHGEAPLCPPTLLLPADAYPLVAAGGLRRQERQKLAQRRHQHAARQVGTFIPDLDVPSRTPIAGSAGQATASAVSAVQDDSDDNSESASLARNPLASASSSAPSRAALVTLPAHSASSSSDADDGEGTFSSGTRQPLDNPEATMSDSDGSGRVPLSSSTAPGSVPTTGLITNSVGCAAASGSEDVLADTPLSCSAHL